MQKTPVVTGAGKSADIPGGDAGVGCQQPVKREPYYNDVVARANAASLSKCGGLLVGHWPFKQRKVALRIARNNLNGHTGR